MKIRVKVLEIKVDSLDWLKVAILGFVVLSMAIAVLGPAPLRVFFVLGAAFVGAFWNEIGHMKRNWEKWEKEFKERGKGA